MSPHPRQRPRTAVAAAPAYVRGWAVDAMAAWLLAFLVATGVDAAATLDLAVLDGVGRAVVALVGMLYLLPLLRHRRGQVSRR